VERPEHYNTGKIETWDWIELGLTDEEFRGYLKGNQLKYMHRYKLKGGVEDLRKMEAYCKRLQEFEDGVRTNVHQTRPFKLTLRPGKYIPLNPFDHTIEEEECTR